MFEFFILPDIIKYFFELYRRHSWPYGGDAYSKKIYLPPRFWSEIDGWDLARGSFWQQQRPLTQKIE